MRELRFRVWDTLEKRMLTERDADRLQELGPSLLAIGLHGLPICIDETSFSEKEIIGWNRDHNLMVMQYTGRKDAYGADIYEKDILRVIHLHDGHEEYWMQPNGPAIPTVIEWNEEMAGWNVPYDTYNFEVIGNIYQHPQLLKEAQEA